MGDVDPNEPKTISISIPMWMYDWLESEGKNINRSQLFRETIEYKMKPHTKQISSVMYLVSIFGICFSVALIGIGVTPSGMDVYVRAMMGILGGVMALSTMLLYYKERKSIAMAE